MLKVSADYLGKTLMKNEFDKSNVVIKEYDIPEEKVKEMAVKVILAKLNTEGYKNAVEILKKFKVDPWTSELEVVANQFFNDMINSRNYEIAAEIGLYFKLSKEKTKKSALAAWENLMNQNEFVKAYEIKKKHRLSNSATKKIASESYKFCMQDNRMDMCKNLRKEYNINISFWQLVIELVKRFITK